MDDPDGTSGQPSAGMRTLTRRGLLRGTAVGVVATPLVALTGTGNAAPGTTTPTWEHAVGAPRGADIATTVGRQQEGRFGLMFKKLPAFSPPDALSGQLARSMADPRAMGQDPSDGDSGDNHAVTGGYTFLGQFFDHDITRDATSIGDQQVDPKALRNFDTAAFDLGSVYGRGAETDPQLYDPARPGWLAVGDHDGVPDLPRAADGSAHLGDPRNDENLIIAQLHAGFLHFHNTLMAEGRTFIEARRLTQWHYQWLLVHEFLPRIVGQPLTDTLSALGTKIKFFKPKNPNRPMIPLEFSVAAYRFGHSMIRPEYEMNDAHTGPVFPHPADGRDSLAGGRPVPPTYRADWTYFFDVPGRPRPEGLNFSRRMDTQLAAPLHDLPNSVVSRASVPLYTDLAERNLLRGARLGLPAGQDVAVELGARALTNAELGLTDPGWGGKAPLWFYVLKEAELLHQGSHLGPVGGSIVAGTMLTLLALDRTSYVNAGRGWRPQPTPFTVGHFLQRAGVV